ncbi:MAG: hypothetical protein NTX76_02940 [Alphaproteobacteria bacterium]|nr:hypothetical protein [Alphaproteobacteria bacterium]
MVVSISNQLSLKSRGRPRKSKSYDICTQDKGTPEFQRKRKQLLDGMGFLTVCRDDEAHQKALMPSLDHCLLHRLFYCGHIDADQMDVGLAYRRLRQKAFRSKGIKTHLQSSSRHWGALMGCGGDDPFEDQRAEVRWAFLKARLQPALLRSENSAHVLESVLDNDCIQREGFPIETISREFLFVRVHIHVRLCGTQ